MANGKYLKQEINSQSKVTGGLAGVYYGIESIPIEWMNTIARRDDILNLASRLETAINLNALIL